MLAKNVRFVLTLWLHDSIHRDERKKEKERLESDETSESELDHTLLVNLQLYHQHTVVKMTFFR